MGGKQFAHPLCRFNSQQHSTKHNHKLKTALFIVWCIWTVTCIHSHESLIHTHFIYFIRISPVCTDIFDLCRHNLPKYYVKYCILSSANFLSNETSKCRAQHFVMLQCFIGSRIQKTMKNVSVKTMKNVSVTIKMYL